MARTYDVHGTKNYLIAAVFLLLISAWHAFDGWFPRASVVETHPQVIHITAPVAGIVQELNTTLEKHINAGEILVVIKASAKKGETHKLKMLDYLSKKAQEKVQKGIVESVDIKRGQSVKPREQLITLKATGDSYYLYNKTTAIISLLIGLICAYIHKAVK